MSNQIYNRIIIDGNNFIYRAYHTKRPPKELHGINTTPIHQFLYMIKNLAERYRPDSFCITWDKRLNPDGINFRKVLTESSYKGQRIETDDTRKIFSYIDIIEDFTDALGIITVYPYNLEADDVIAYFSKMDDESNIIISSDRDLLQLVSEKTHVLLTSKNILVTLDNFEEVAGVKKENFVLYKAILGDISDNIQGLDKYGPIKAKKLAEDYNYNNLTKEQQEILDRNIKIMDLGFISDENDCEYNSYEKQYNEKQYLNYDGEKLKNLFEKYQFFNFRRTMGEWTSLFNTKNMNIDLLLQISI